MANYSGNATVKSVLSGDTIVLVGKATNGPPPEITLTLNDIQCPKVARGSQQTDEEYAWQSREFLRNLCIGKPVSFSVTQRAPTINRTFGYAMLNGENLSKTILSAGWAVLKESRDSSDDVTADLNAAFQHAKTAKLGMHSDNVQLKRSSVRHINWNLDAETFFKDISKGGRRGRESPVVTVIFEHVRDGATFRCYVPSVCAYVTVSLAGVVCPRVNAAKTSSGNDQPEESSGPEPFALQGKLFTELRVLNRELSVAVHSASSKGGGDGTLLATILHPKGNITLELIKAGLGRVADWTLAVLPREEVVAVRAAENEAKAARRGVWSDYRPPEPDEKCRVFEGRVVEVLTGDTIVVAENSGGGYIESKVTLSSVRTPRLGSLGKNSTQPEPYALECKEFVRSNLIGNQVYVSVEYVRKTDTGVREYGSVYFGKAIRRDGVTIPSRNIAQLLVSQGLAFTVKHRGDEPRAEAFDMMLVDEAEAIALRKGVHSSNAKSTDSATAGKLNDVSSDGKKAKTLFSVFQKDRVYRGLVDHVFTGSRFKITIPSENICFQLALSQVRCHNLPKKDSSTAEQETAESSCVATWAEAAKKFTRLNVLQRMVDVEITDIDRNGIMLGKLYVAESETKQSRRNVTNSYAYALVQEGLAWVDRFAALRGGSEIDSLVEAQSLCQRNSTGLWAFPDAMPQDHSASDQADGKEDSDTSPTNDELVLVKVSEIYDGSNFCVNVVSGVANEKFSDFQKSTEITELMKSHDSETGDAVTEPRNGLIVACHDDTGDEGNAWIRARIEEVLPDNKVKVFFLDYGHRDVVSSSSLRTLSENLASITPQAIECTLAIVKAPPLGSEYGVASARALNSLVWDKNCAMRVVSAPFSASAIGSGRPEKGQSGNKTKYEVVLYALPTVTDIDTQSQSSIDDYINVNNSLVKNGFARISATSRKSIRRKGGRKGPVDTFAADLLQALESSQSEAHDAHLRIWTYGHPGDSDDEAEERRKPSAASAVGGKA